MSKMLMLKPSDGRKIGRIKVGKFKFSVDVGSLLDVSFGNKTLLPVNFVRI
jgi:hypothetical protein